MIVKQKSLGMYLNKVCATGGDMTTRVCGKTITLTPYEMYEILQAYYNELDTQGFTTTINETIASLYKDYGYIVEAEGIGWKVKRAK